MIRSMARLFSQRRFSTYAWGAVLALLTAAVTWLWAHDGPHEALPTRGAKPLKNEKGEVTGVILSREARDALDVQIADVLLRPVEERVLAYATLVAPWQQHAFVTSRLPGRIAALNVKPGQTVSAGQVLAEVESLELKTLQLELANAQNDIRLSSKIVEELVKTGEAVPGQRLLEARAKHRQDLNALDIAKSKWFSLGLSKSDLDRLLQEPSSQPVRSLPIRSPISGVVIHADLVVGKVVDPLEHLFEIVDLASVWVKIGVLEKDLHKVTVGQPVELSLAAYPGESFRPQVQVKGLYLDPQTHVGTAWTELVNPSGAMPRFLPGMHGQAQLLLDGAAKVKTVPAAAVIGDGAERYVLVVTSDTVAASEYRKVNVVVGRQSGDTVEIRGGEPPYPGDRVVTQGSHELAGFFVQGVLRLSPEAAQNIGLRVEPVGRHAVDDVLEVDGAVDVPPDQRTFASAQLAGTLQKINVERGQAVKAGEAIAEIASLELQNLQLDLLRAHLEAELQAETLERLKQVIGVLSGRQLWETQSAHNAAVNRRDSLKQKLQTIGLSAEQVAALLAKKQLVETMPIRAPIDGVLVHFDKILGQVIKAEEPLFEIHDLSRVWVKGHLSELHVSQVRIGQPVRVRLAADPSFLAEAKVVRSGWILGTDDRTLSVWIELDNPPTAPLQHNMLARLSFVLRQPAPTLAVPRSAVIWDGTRGFVFVQKPDGVFDRRLVETGAADDRFFEITSGLQPGERIAVRGTADLQTAYAGIR
jgi:RND family efflux transporter MFP subunit